MHLGPGHDRQHGVRRRRRHVRVASVPEPNAVSRRAQGRRSKLPTCRNLHVLQWHGRLSQDRRPLFQVSGAIARRATVLCRRGRGRADADGRSAIVISGTSLYQHSGPYFWSSDRTMVSAYFGVKESDGLLLTAAPSAPAWVQRSINHGRHVGRYGRVPVGLASGGAGSGTDETHCSRMTQACGCGDVCQGRSASTGGAGCGERSDSGTAI